jgi:signal transduction histidine kinase
LAIITDILDFSKIEAGKMDIDASPFDLRRVLDEIAEMMAPRASEKGIDLVVHYPAPSPSAFPTPRSFAPQSNRSFWSSLLSLASS